MKDLKFFKNEFLEYLEIEKGRSVKTVENYDRYLVRFLSHANVGKPDEISEKVIREFRLHLNRQNLKLKTQNFYLIALRAFLKFLRRREIGRSFEFLVLDF